VTSTQEPQKTPASARPRRTWFRVLLMFLLPLAAVLVAALVVIYGGGSRSIAAARNEAKARGIAVSLEELAGKLPVVTDEENTAFVYRSAFVAFQAAGGGEPDARDAPYGRCVPIVSRWLYQRRSDDPQVVQARKDLSQMEADPRTPMPDYMLTATEYYVDRRKQTVELVGKAHGLGQARYDYAFPSGNVSYLSPLREITRLMALAAWVDAEEDRPADAILRIRESLSMGRSLRDDPRSISSLVSMAMAAITTRTALPRVLARTNPSNADLAALQRDVERFADEFSLRLGLEGEIAQLLQNYEDVELGKTPIQNVCSPSVYIGLGGRPVEASWVDRNLSSVLSVFYKRDVATSVRYYLWALDHIDGDPRTFANSSDSLLTAIRNGRYVIARSCVDSTQRLPTQAELMRSTLQATAAALAACRYRNDHGTWPESLDALVPGYIDKVPLDPMTGKPLVYRIEETGIVVYSIGENGVDDGGKGYLGGSYTGGDDYGLRVWK